MGEISCQVLWLAPGSIGRKGGLLRILRRPTILGYRPSLPMHLLISLWLPLSSDPAEAESS